MVEHTNGAHRGIRFDPVINLGHIGSAAAFLATTVFLWATLSSRVEQQSKDIERVDKMTVSVENRLVGRINEERARLDQTQVRTADDVREIKQLMRDGFRDLDAKLDRKADKPTR